MELHTEGINCVALLSDGRTVASASDDKNVHLWDVETGAHVAELSGHDSRVWTVCFHPDGQHLASGSDNGAVLLWNLSEEGRPFSEVYRAPNHRDILGLTYSPTGNKLAVLVAEERTVILNTEGQQLRSLPQADALAWTSDGLSMVIATTEGEEFNLTDVIRILSWGTGRELASLRGHNDFINTVAVSADGWTAASASMDLTLRIWDLHQTEYCPGQEDSGPVVWEDQESAEHSKPSQSQGVINYVTPEDTDYPEIDPEDKALRDAAVSVIKTHLLLRTPPDLDLTPAEIAQGMSSILEKHKNLEKNCSQFSVVATDVLRVWREKNPELDPTGVGAAAVDDAEAAAAESMPTDEAAQDEYIDESYASASSAQTHEQSPDTVQNDKTSAGPSMLEEEEEEEKPAEDSNTKDAADAADAATYVTPKETDYPEIKPKDKRLRDVAVTVVKTHLMLQQQSNLDLTPAEIAKGMSVILASDDPSPYVILATDVLRVWREKNPTLDPIRVGAAAVDETEAAAAESMPTDEAAQDEYIDGAHVGTIVKLDIYADFGCPFCYVGTRHLFKAMTAFPEVRFQITWKPYLIDLGVPKKGVLLRDCEEDYLGDAAHLIQNAARAGIPFRDWSYVSNTLQAHRLVQYAQRFGRGTDVVKSIFRATFEMGQNVSDVKVLVDIGRKWGLTGVEKFMQSEEGMDEIPKQAQIARDEEDIFSVPQYYLNGMWPYHGTMSFEQWREVLSEQIDD
jgi:predicted DsbA family dithiol-disulfide isomerase